MKTFLSISLLIFINPFSYGQTWSTLGSGTNDVIYSILADTSNNQLYVGGQFTTAGGIAANSIAVWNGTLWDSLSSGMNGNISTLAIYNGELYAGGYFTTAGGNATNYIAKWDGSTWTSVGTGFNNGVFCLQTYNGKLYAGGYFTTADGNSAKYIAKWDGSTWTSVGTGFNNSVITLQTYNGKLYAGGGFTMAGNDTVNYIASWDGSTWSSVSSGVNNYVSSLAEYNGLLYLGGNFTVAGGIPTNHIASWNGLQYDSLSTGVNSAVKTLISYNCELYAGGQFDTAGGIFLNQSPIAKWNGTGWSTVGSGINGFTIEALSVLNGNLYVGGGIFLPGNNILKWNTPVPPAPIASFNASDTNIQTGSYIQFTNTTSASTAQWVFQGGIPTTSTENNPIVYYPNVGTYDVSFIVSTCSGSDTLIHSAYINVDTNIHPIPYGTYFETLSMPDGYYWTIGYYKPLSYDSLNSDIILYCHGTGGTAYDGYQRFHDIADRRNALVVTPFIPSLGWSYAQSDFNWLPPLFKILYQHILYRENRDSINVRLVGFSSGGQCVTRYMLIRQALADSIPIKMAISINPYSYTFPCDSLNGVHFIWYCGPDLGYFMTSSCQGIIKDYYNENYTVMIGTADTVSFNSTGCYAVEGASRYERAMNFYSFCQQDAIDRGTTLKWNYAEVPDVGHNSFEMINNTASPSDTVTICEHYLFDMPYHEPEKFPPTADFDYSTNNFMCVVFNADCKCRGQMAPTTYSWDFDNGITDTGQYVDFVEFTENGIYNVQLIASNIYGSDTIVKPVIVTGLPVADFFVSDSVITFPDSTVYFTFAGLNADSLYWDFGDGSYSNSINPTHTYQDSGSYTVTLYAFNGNNCMNSATKTIVVNSLSSVNSISFSNYFAVYPNPTNVNLTISIMNNQLRITDVSILDITGKQVKRIKTKGQSKKYIVNIKDLPAGLYFVKMQTNNGLIIKKLIIN